jgi:dTDP-4-dehydrorhamnose 3,5-epimerase
MKKHETPIQGLYIIEPEVYGDERGFFFEAYNKDKYDALGVPSDFVQMNRSKSQKGVLRGLHFQYAPKQVGKLVHCNAGRVFDVAVDFRPDSPTYKQWYGIELSEENKLSFYIPPGFGHGFYALTDCEVQYLMTGTFSGEHDGSVAWNDPDLGIEWPLEGDPILSEKDRTSPRLKDVTRPIL